MCARPAWQELINCCIRQERKPTSYFLQLASLTVSGEASCRTVVFRGWHETASSETPSLLIATDARSAKVHGLFKYPRAEACWYFLEPRVQFRIVGDVSVITSDETNHDLSALRVKQWNDLSPAARALYMCPHPGRPKEKEYSKEQIEEVANSQHPLEWFAVLSLRPERVDNVDLRANDRRLFELDSDGNWIENYINP